MPSEADLVTLWDTLGATLLYDELRGDFAAARRLVDLRLRETDEAPDADLLLFGGLLRLLQGEPVAGRRLLARATDLAAQDPDRLLVAFAATYLAQHEQFNTLPDGAGCPLTEVEDRWSAVRLAVESATEWGHLVSRSREPLAQCLALQAYSLLPGLRAARQSVQLARHVPTSSVEKVLKDFSALLDLVRGLGLAGCLQGGSALADLIESDLAWRGGLAERAAASLDRASAGYVAAADAVGEAVCHMTRGDRAAAPFTSPITADLLLQASTSEENDLGWAVEMAERDVRQVDATAAEVAYRRARRLFEQAGAARGVAAIALRQGHLSAVRDHHDGAVELFGAARRLAARCGDRRLDRLAVAHGAIALVAAGDGLRARELVGELCATARTGQDLSFNLGLGLMFSRAGRHWLVRRGDYEASLALHDLAGRLNEAVGADVSRSQSLADRARAYQAAGEWPAAVPLLEQARDLVERTRAERPELRRPLLRRAANLTTRVFQLHQANMDAPAMQRSARRMRHLLAEVDAAVAVVDAGVAEPATLQDEAAEVWALRHSLQWETEHIGVLAPLYAGLAAQTEDRQAEAETLFEAALSRAREARPGSQDFLLATVHATLRQYDAAVTAFEAFLAQGGLNAGFGGTLTRLFAAAGADAEVQLQARRNHELALGFFLGVQAYDQAREHLEALEAIAGPEWWRQTDPPWESLALVGEVREGLADLPAALAIYDAAIELLESRRSLLRDVALRGALAGGRGAQRVYFQAARAAAKVAEAAPDPSAAREAWAQTVRYAERGRARELLDLLARGRARSDSARQNLAEARRISAEIELRRVVLAAEHEAEHVDAARIAQLLQETEDLEGQLARLMRLEASLAADADEASAAEVLSLDEMCAALPPDCALLQYHHLDDSLLAWSLSANGLVEGWHSDVDSRALERRMRRFHRLCATRAAAAEDVGREIGATLLAPFARTLECYPRLVVVPYGAGHLLPFHALPWQDGPLAESHALTYLPSASALSHLNIAQPIVPRRLLSVGDPARMARRTADGGTVAADPLPFAALEAAAVARGAPESHVILGEEATEDLLRRLLPEHDVIHLATHGILDEQVPLRSAILLADGGSIQVSELLGMSLDAALVTLSACQTGRGQVSRGDDVVGFTQGLLAAGAQRALVSLWPVDDAHTCLFMIEFYRQLQTTDDPATALQRAQRRLRSTPRSRLFAALSAEGDALRAVGGDIARLDAAVRARHVVAAGDEGGAAAGEPGQASDAVHPFYWAGFVMVG